MSNVILRAWVLSALVCLVAGCGGDGGGAPTTPPAVVLTPPAPTPPPVPATATYDFVYEPRISGNPVAVALGAMPLPEGVDLAPSAALIAHPAGEAPWEEGGFASAEMRAFAATGDATVLTDAGESRGHQVIARTNDEVGALLLRPVLELTLDNPCVSHASKLVPSPDWFIGFSGICTLDDAGHWLDQVTLTMVAYDAGIADGSEWTSNDHVPETDPPEPIAELDIEPFRPAGTPVAIITATRRQ